MCDRDTCNRRTCVAAGAATAASPCAPEQTSTRTTRKRFPRARACARVLAHARVQARLRPMTKNMKPLVLVVFFFLVLAEDPRSEQNKQQHDTKRPRRWRGGRGGRGRFRISRGVEGAGSAKDLGVGASHVRAAPERGSRRHLKLTTQWTRSGRRN